MNDTDEAGEETYGEMTWMCTERASLEWLRK